MRRIIIIGIALFCIILTLFTIYTGLPLFKVAKIGDIKQQYNNTTKAIGDLSKYKGTDYKNAEKELNTSLELCKQAQEDYEAAAALRTEEDIQDVLQTKAYDIEYIWVKIGNYAYNNNVDLQIDIYKTEGETADNDYVLSDLKISCVSSYYGMISFIEQISRDSDLKFIPQNIKMTAEWKDVVSEEIPTQPLYIDKDFNDISGKEKQKKLVLSTVFYKTDIPLSKDSLLKVENPESVTAEREAAEAAAKEASKSKDKGNTTNTTNSTNTTKSASGAENKTIKQ